MEEFLRSPAGTFFLFLVSAGPFLLAGLGSIGRWKPAWIVLGELLLALLVGVAWVVGNLLATWTLGFIFLTSLVMIAVGWWKQKRGMPQIELKQ
jgi:hypothetical protein